MFIKKPELPPRPIPPSINQVLEDLENAPKDDPVFADAEQLQDFTNDPSYAKARENMELCQRLRELAQSLANKKLELEDDINELKEMNENIKKQSQQALQRVNN